MSTPSPRTSTLTPKALTAAVGVVTALVLATVTPALTVAATAIEYGLIA